METDRQTHRMTTITLAAHACRGLMISVKCDKYSVYNNFMYLILWGSLPFFYTILFSMCIIHKPFILLWGMCNCLVYKVCYSYVLVHKVFISFMGRIFLIGQ